MLTQSDFDAYAAQGYNRIPVVLTLFADLDTPLSVYLKLANQPYSYVLESVTHQKHSGRYSFIGLPSNTRLRASAHTLNVEHKHRILEHHHGDPLAFIAQFQQRFRTPLIADLPCFTGGLVGYFAYETAKPTHTPSKPHPNTTPDILLMLSEELAIIDHLSSTLFLVIHADPAVPNSYQKAHNRLAALREKIRQPLSSPQMQPSTATHVHTEWNEQAFKHAVQHIQQLISTNEVTHVALSQLMTMPFSDSPLALYRALRRLTPAPSMFFYHCDDFHVVGSSQKPRLQHNTPYTPHEHAPPHTPITSTTEATLINTPNPIEVFKKTFPAVTHSGSPKLRAMKIIDELEPFQRGIYSGAIGYLGFDGNMDLAVAHRTALIKNQTLSVQVGTQVAANSDPQHVWRETSHQAHAIIRAAEWVQTGLDA